MSSTQEIASSTTSTLPSSASTRDRRRPGPGGRRGDGRRGNHPHHPKNPTESQNSVAGEDPLKPILPTSGATPISTTSAPVANNNNNSSSSEGEEEDELLCLTCCEPLKEYGVGQCNHRDMCAMCTLKRRELYKEHNCPICKTPLPTVVYTRNSEKPFDEFVLKSLIHDLKTNSYFDDEDYYKSITKLWEFKCPACSHIPFPNFDQLRKHVKREHKLVYCELCVADRKVFFSEQSVYTHNELMRHMMEWDGGVGAQDGGGGGGSSSSSSSSSSDTRRWKGHPMCEFCSKHFYGMDQLYKHLQENHFTCHVCERAGVMYQYYRDYPELQRHFNTEHYPCTHPDCLAQKFVVFGSSIDLKAHQLTHSNNKKGGSRSDRQLDIQFTYLRAGRSGEGVDDALERPYKHRARRRAAGYSAEDSDGEEQQQQQQDTTPSSSSNSNVNPAPTKKKGKSKKPQNGTSSRTEDDGGGGGGGDDSSSAITTTSTTASNGRPLRAPQSFAPGFRNRDIAAPSSSLPSSEQPDDPEKAAREEKEREARAQELRDREAKLARELQERERERDEQEREERRKERNKQLVKDLKSAIGESAYAKLREASAGYRNGDMSDRDYYNSLFNSLRSNPHLLVSLIALLPDVEKRTRLERIHHEYTLWESAYPSLQSEAPAPKLQGKWKGKEKVPIAAPKSSWDVPKKAPDSKCPLCGDMIPSRDKDKHDYYHQHGSPYTPLSSSPPSTTTYYKSNGTTSTTSTTTATTATKTKPPPSTSTTTPTTTNISDSYPTTSSLSTYPSTSTTTTSSTPSTSSSSSWEAAPPREESFPSLTSTSSSLAALSLSAWSSGGRGRGGNLQQQDFPTLSSGAPSSGGGAPQQPQGAWGERGGYDDFEEETLQKRPSGKKKKQKQVLFRVG